MTVARRGFLKASAAALAVNTLRDSLLPTYIEAQREEASWDKQTDIVIIGSGIAGICAAIEAADAGSQVMVLEKDAQPGGCAKFSGGHMTVAGTHLQKQAGIEDHPDWLYTDMMVDGEGIAVPELVRKYVDAGPEHIVWLEACGVRFSTQFQADSNTDRIRPGVGRGHMIDRSKDYPGGPHQGGLGLMLMLLRAAKRRGVEPLLNHTALRLLSNPSDGSVLGVQINSGEISHRIRAKRAVILASGGWSGNAEMAIAEDPRIDADIFPDCWPYHLCLGEGLLAGVDAGAQLSNMAYGGYLMPRWGSRVYQIWEPPTFDNPPSIHTGLSIADFSHVVLVNGRGRRFVDESLGDPKGVPLPGYTKFSYMPGSFPRHPFIETYLNLHDRPRNVWAITDRNGAAALGWTGYEAEMRTPAPKAGLALYPEMTAIADSLAELAKETGIEPGGLHDTISRYNGFAVDGNDSEFGKPKGFASLNRPPYYAAQMALLKHTRRNGIRVNTKGQVLSRKGLSATADPQPKRSIDDEPIIPGLYAAGECAHYLGNSHGHGTLGIYSYFGRVAGRQAAIAQKAHG